MTQERKKLLQELAAKNGTPLFVVDHEILSATILRNSVKNCRMCNRILRLRLIPILR